MLSNLVDYGTTSFLAALLIDPNTYTDTINMAQVSHLIHLRIWRKLNNIATYIKFSFK